MDSAPPAIVALPAAPAARPEITRLVTRGVMRVMVDLGAAPILEWPLPNGRRVDVAALSRRGEITIVEIKSGIEDFRADGKWADYAPWCDAFYFGVAPDFPMHVLPPEVGLIVADGFGGAVVRPAVKQSLAPARRRALLLDFARLAALRLSHA